MRVIIVMAMQTTLMDQLYVFSNLVQGLAQGCHPWPMSISITLIYLFSTVKARYKRISQRPQPKGLRRIYGERQVI